jgi:hypothetical protein
MRDAVVNTPGLYVNEVTEVNRVNKKNRVDSLYIMRRRGIIPAGSVNPSEDSMARTRKQATEAGLKAIRLEVPIEVHQRLRVEAAKLGKSMAAQVRDLVDEFLAKRKGVGK